MTKSDLVVLRNYTADDKNFIYASWLRGLYYGDGWYSNVPKNSFMENYHKVLDFIMNSRDTLILIACLKDEPGAIVGYSVLNGSKEAIHWVFVKKAWRGIGVAKSLVPDAVKTYTHVTKIGESINKKRNFTFDPFII